MGFGGISAWQLIIVLVIVLVIFGTKKLRGVGGDLGSAIKSFKKAVKEDPAAKKAAEEEVNAKENGDEEEAEAIESIATDSEVAAKSAASEKSV